MFTTSGTYPWSVVTHILHNSQASRGCDRNIFEVMTNVHPPNHFEHKKRIWYDYICPHEKEEMTRTTSRQDIA